MYIISNNLRISLFHKQGIKSNKYAINSFLFIISGDFLSGNALWFGDFTLVCFMFNDLSIREIVYMKYSLCS